MDDHLPVDSTAGLKQHREWAAELCDPADPRTHHYAMMELGQTICRPGLPRCELCPVARFCKTSFPEDLPVKKPRAKISHLSEHAIFARDPSGNLLLHLESGSRREGLWKLPLRSADSCATLSLLAEDSYPITRYKVSLKVFASDKPEILTGDEWVSLHRAHTLPMAAPFRRVLSRLLDDL